MSAHPQAQSGSQVQQWKQTEGLQLQRVESSMGMPHLAQTSIFLAYLLSPLGTAPSPRSSKLAVYLL